MKISTRTRYGLRTMLEIAQNKNTKGVLQKDIASNQALSNKYLDHIIHALKTAGLIVNAKGKKSGYVLTRNPEKISVLDVHNAFEPEICLVECLSDNFKCERINICLSQCVWKELNRMVINYLKSISLADLMSKKPAFQERDFINQLT